MPNPYSEGAREQLYRTSADDRPVLLLEIEHPDLPEPARAAQGDTDIEHLGNTFQAVAFGAKLPDDMDGPEPRARLAIGNVGRELVDWLEASNGGAGATVRFIEVRKSDPDHIERELTMDLSDVQMDPLEITGKLGFDSLINTPGVRKRYTPETSPGIF